MPDERDELLTQAVRLRRGASPEMARERLIDLVARFPDDAEVAYEMASICDVIGLEAEAAPYYERALALVGLSAEDRLGAFVGLGSTYRVLGEFERSAVTLRRGLGEFPDDDALRTFLALALYNLGEGRDAVATLLRLLVETSSSVEIGRYRRALEFYAEDLDATV